MSIPNLISAIRQADYDDVQTEEEKRIEEMAERGIRMAAMARAAVRLGVTGDRGHDNRVAVAADEREDSLPALWQAAGLTHRYLT